MTGFSTPPLTWKASLEQPSETARPEAKLHQSAKQTMAHSRLPAVLEPIGSVTELKAFMLKAKSFLKSDIYCYAIE